MTSNNMLLGHGGSPEAVEQVPRKRQIWQSIPAWLYHRDFEAKIFYTLEAFNQAKTEGWVDSPAKVNDPPPEEATKNYMEEKPTVELDAEEPTPKPDPQADLFVCEVCGRAFGKRVALMGHSQTHRVKA